jgi:hypothetical protein
MVLHYCAPRQHEVNRSFYYWKQRCYIYENDKRVLDTLNISTFYVKTMDVDYSELSGAIPSSTVYYSGYNLPDSISLVPVVYITNRTFLKLDMKSSEELAYKVYRKIGQVIGNDSVRVSEIQIDCDWNSSSRDKYFAFLKSLKTITDMPLSATIRLHQVKYRSKTGVPPVDKGMLMFYNMSPATKNTSLNSIIDIEEAKKYVNSNTAGYPLQLDAALPLFCWAKAFRGEKLIGLLNYTGDKEMQSLKFFRQEEMHSYRSIADTVYAGIYFRKGDLIRVEEPSAEQLEEAAEITSDFIGNEKLNVAFYHWDTTLINKYGYETLSRIYDSYR